MVGPDKIIIEPHVFIFLLNTKNGVDYMLSINGSGSCGKSSSKNKAIEEILLSGRLSENQIKLIKGIGKKKNIVQLELF